MNKKQRRIDMKAKLSELDEADMNSKSVQLSKNLLELLNSLHIIQRKDLIGAFAPFECEPVWYTAFESEINELTAFPALESSLDGMCFKKANRMDLVFKRDFGSPIYGPPDEAEVVVPDLLLVPGLAMSSKGERLGRGKGFYDRYMENFRGKKIGICFELQLDDSLPTEKHDVLLDYIVTEFRIIKCI